MAATANPALDLAVDAAAKGALQGASQASIWSTTGNAFATAGKWVADGAVYIVTWIKDAAIASWAWLSQFVFSPVGHACVTAWNWVAYTAAPAVWNALSPVLKPIGYILYEIGKGIAEVLWTILKGIYHYVTGTAVALWTLLSTAAQHVATFFVAVWDKLVDVFGPAASVIWSAMQYLGMIIWSGMQTAGAAIWSGMQIAGSAIWSGLQVVGEAFANAGKATLNMLTTAGNFVAAQPWWVLTLAALGVAAVGVGIYFLVRLITG